MREAASGSGSPCILVCALLLVAGLLFLAGCTAAPPQGGAVPAPTPASTALQSKIVHVTGNDRGTLILIGRSDCPWCQKTKGLLANLSVGYYWIDLNTLDETETAQVMSSLKICSDTSAVPILVINGERCITGYQEEQIREAVG